VRREANGTTLSLKELESHHQPWYGKPDWRTLTEPSWLMHKGLSEALSRRAKSVRGDVLDYGCGEMPYRSLFTHSTSYIGADVANPNADIIYEPEAGLPLSDGSVDGVLSTQVLEHVRDPAQYLAECRRVLRPMGRLLLTTHGFWAWHGPGDWRRWTHEGLIYDVESAGFRVLDLDAVCIARVFFLQFMNVMVFSRLSRRSLTYPLGAALIAMSNVVGTIFRDEIVSASAKEATHIAFAYLVVAERAE
jgi:SAM-dependent methyltransferase